MKVHIDFKVRPATLADAPYVATAISHYLEEKEGMEVSEARQNKILASVMRWLLEGGASVIHVATIEKHGKERIIGVAAFDFVDDPYSDMPGLLVRHVYVYKNYRNGEVEHRLRASILATYQAVGASDVHIMQPMRGSEI